MINFNTKHSALYLGVDMLTLILAFLISVFLFNDKKIQEGELTIFLGFVVLWFVIGYRSNLYNINLESGLSKRFINYLKAYVSVFVLVYILYAFFPVEIPARDLVIATIVGLPLLGIPTNLLLVKTINRLKASNHNKKYTLVAGVGNVAGNVEKLLSRDHSSRQIRGFIKCKDEECVVGQDKVVGDINNIRTYLKDNPVDEIIIALPVKPSKKIRNIIAAADYHGVRVKYIPDYQGLFGENYKITRQGEIVAVNVRPLPLDETSAFYMKSCFDYIFATMALIGLAPLFLVLAVLIKLDSPGPVFYCPIRIGKGGKPFRIFKFRSMRENDDVSGGTLSTRQEDPRITRIGRIMRKYSMDELPQFMNVLLGDMSVVGPRPHRSYLNQQLQESVDKYMIRHYFKPGITGWAQVNGWRGPTETFEQKSQRTLHDIWYMENWSFMLDLRIVYMTIFDRKAHKNAF